MIEISQNFVPQVPVADKSALVQVMACRLSSNKSLSKPMMTKDVWCRLTSEGCNDFQEFAAFHYNV